MPKHAREVGQKRHCSARAGHQRCGGSGHKEQLDRDAHAPDAALVQQDNNECGGHSVPKQVSLPIKASQQDRGPRLTTCEVNALWITKVVSCKVTPEGSAQADDNQCGRRDRQCRRLGHPPPDEPSGEQRHDGDGHVEK